jgi:hypothetical protein
MAKVINENIVFPSLGPAVIDSASQVFDIDDMAGYSCQVVWTSAACTGTLKVQESNNDGTSWTDTALVATFANNNGNVMLHPTTSWRFVGQVRLKLDIAVGSLTSLVCVFHAKG